MSSLTTREHFETIFKKENPEDAFETKAVREEYKRTAWQWYRRGYDQRIHEEGFNIPFEK